MEKREKEKREKEKRKKKVFTTEARWQGPY